VLFRSDPRGRAASRRRGPSRGGSRRGGPRHGLSQRQTDWQASARAMPGPSQGAGAHGPAAQASRPRLLRQRTARSRPGAKVPAAGQGQRRAGDTTDGFHEAVQDGRAVGRTVSALAIIGRLNGLKQNRKRNAWAGLGSAGPPSNPFCSQFQCIAALLQRRPTSAQRHTHSPKSPRNLRLASQRRDGAPKRASICGSICA
jgi:hypothetical protein